VKRLDTCWDLWIVFYYFHISYFNFIAWHSHYLFKDIVFKSTGSLLPEYTETPVMQDINVPNASLSLWCRALEMARLCSLCTDGLSQALLLGCCNFKNWYLYSCSKEGYKIDHHWWVFPSDLLIQISIAP